MAYREYRIKITQAKTDYAISGSADQLLVDIIEKIKECVTLIKPPRKKSDLPSKNKFRWIEGVIRVVDTPECMLAFNDWSMSIEGFLLKTRRITH